MRHNCLFLMALLGLAACNEVPDTRAAGAATRDTLLAAEAQFDQTAFDTIQWPTANAAIERGAVVWKVGCVQCHGAEGLGDAGYVNEQGDTIRPPSFQAPDWALARNPREIRRKIYVGNALGMPHWGLRHMAPRDIDAVTEYITQHLRANKS